MIAHLSLFSGIGGADLAAEWAGFTNVGSCDTDEYASRVHAKHWPDVPNFGDIRGLTRKKYFEATGLHTATVISGGFPCQPFSNAGKRRGTEDDRYLWPEMLRVIKELRPTWVVGENVAGFISMGLDRALSDLEAAGYSARAFMVPACAVGAWHTRQRVFIVANSEGERFNHGDDGKNQREASGEVNASSGAGVCGRAENVADASIEGIRRLPVQQRRSRQTNPDTNGCGEDVCNSSSSGLPDRASEASGQEPQLGRSDWWATEPDVGRMAHGIPSRVHRLRCLGNAIVPQQIYPIFRAIAELELI